MPPNTNPTSTNQVIDLDNSSEESVEISAPPFSIQIENEESLSKLDET